LGEVLKQGKEEVRNIRAQNTVEAPKEGEKSKQELLKQKHESHTKPMDHKGKLGNEVGLKE